MAWLFGDSFDHYTFAQRHRKWNGSSFPRAENTIGAYGRYGTSGFRLYMTGGWDNYMFKVLDTPAPSSPTCIVGMALKVVTAPTAGRKGYLWQIKQNDTYQFSLTLNSDLTLSILRGGPAGVVLGTTVRALNTGVWAYIEVKVLIDGAVGTAEVRVNGEAWAPFPLAGLNTRGAATTPFTLFQIGDQVNGVEEGDYNLDDIYVLDGTDSGVVGNPLNDFLGDTRGEAIFPDANGANSEWDGSDGNKVDNYQLVDDNPADDETSYIYGRTAGTKDTHKFPLIASEGSIRCVQHLLAMRKTDTATKTVKSVVRGTDGVDRDSAATQNPGQLSYDYYRFNHPADPRTSLPWVKADLSGVAGSEFGPKVTV
jgi:hypothetical protein